MSRRQHSPCQLTPVARELQPTRRRQGDATAGTRMECWAAYSVGPDGQRDGRWVYQRVDGEPGTPWEIGHAATRQCLPYVMYPTLDDARRATHTDPVRILTGILAYARRVAGSAGHLQVSRDRAAAAVPLLEAALVDAHADRVAAGVDTTRL